MEMNGSLESSSAGLQAQGGRGSEEEEEDEDEDEETTRKGIALQRFWEYLIINPAFDLFLFAFVVAASSQPTRKPRVALPNGKVTSGDSHLSNGSRSRSTLNGEDSQDAEPMSNGHYAGEELAVGGVSAPGDQLVQSVVGFCRHRFNGMKLCLWSTRNRG